MVSGNSFYRVEGEWKPNFALKIFQIFLGCAAASGGNNKFQDLHVAPLNRS